ncbi:hypothetical protein [Miniphocaeibacter massiliensis]|uniref:hypothetical protein n=1 Tax=Miniphocaeibacter massiliensis TaxID=2041841 RepID=UPI000C1BA0E2|nr:hypothetical protein [Miniphocaeibacter massiliensis]
MDNNILKIIFCFIPSFLLILGGILFVKFKNVLWNNPLYLIFKKNRTIVNITTGKLWILGDILLSFTILIFKLFDSMMTIAILYLFIVAISYFISYFIVKRKIKYN